MIMAEYICLSLAAIFGLLLIGGLILEWRKANEGN